MKTNSLRIFLTTFIFLMIAPQLEAQTKRIKRPRGSIGVYSADKFVRESFDIYDKVYRYDGYAEAGKPLTDDDINTLEYALNDAEGIMASAPNVIADLDGAGVLKQAKGVAQINKAKKALRYCIETIPKLLAGRDSKEGEGDGDENTENSENSEGNESDESSESSESTSGSGGGNGQVTINSKFDFVPGDELLFFDDFGNDFVGDFPARWNTNGTGEVVTFGDDPTKWLQLQGGYRTLFVPDVASLPEDYTIEFDVVSNGVTRNTSSAARFRVSLETDNGLSETDDVVQLTMSYPQYTATDVRIYSRVPGQDDINNVLQQDLREAQKSVHHVSIAVNKRRVRMWVNQTKIIDVPRALPENSIMNGVKLNMHGFKDGERLFVTNFKVAKGGVDLRRKLMAEGSISTNGILFDSGSSTIKPQSYGIIKQISQVLQQDKNIKLLIVGHTDSDGDDDSNLALSKSRAGAVKQALIDVYGVDGSRLTTDGKGESDPVADNGTSEGKAQNRRVVFKTVN